MVNENASELQAVLQAISHGVIIQGPHAEILSCNQAALDMLGLTEDQLLGRTSYDPRWLALHEDGSPFPGETHPVPQAIRTKQPVYNVVMSVYRPTTDNRVWLRVDAVPQMNAHQEIVRVVCSFIDITARKQAEIALEATNQALEQRVQERTEQLEKARMRLQLLTDNASDLICLHAPDGEYLYVSPSCETMVGYTIEEMLHTNPYNYFHPDDLAEIRASHDTSLEGNSPRIVYRFHTKSGDYIWLETFTRPIVNSEGVVENLVTVSRDITDRKLIQEELRQERDLLSHIMETSPAGITVVDKDGRISFSNRRAGEIHGRPDAAHSTYDAPAWRATDYEGNPWPDEKQPFTIVMRTKQPVYDVRHAIEWEDGHRIYLAINGAPLFDEAGEISKVVFTIEDYTQRKYWQDELEAALVQEKHLNQLKSRFISTVSHEFRTPMSVIMTSTDILRMHYDKLTPDQIRERLDKISDQVQRLTRLLEDVTFINKSDMTGHRLNPRDIDLEVFFKELIKEMHLVYTNPVSIVLERDGGCNHIRIDESMLYQIFTNLVSNAVKYSPNGQTVSIRYQCDEKASTFQVKDTGIGIPLEDQSHLFELFHRATNVGTISGTGMGLVIAKEAVDRLGGEITFESHEHQGTTFTVTLPHLAPETHSISVTDIP